MGHKLQLDLRKSGILGILLLALVSLGLWEKEMREPTLSHSGGDSVQAPQTNAGQADQALPLPASSMPAVPGNHTRMIALTDVEGRVTVQRSSFKPPRKPGSPPHSHLTGKISSKLDIADYPVLDIWDISFTEEGYPEWCTTATPLSSGSETGDLSSLFMGSPLPVSSPIWEDISNEENKHCDCCVEVARGRGKNLPTFDEVAPDDRDKNETLDESEAEDLLDVESEADESSVSSELEPYSCCPKTSEPGHGDYDICGIDEAETLMVSVLPPVDSLENLSPLSDLSTKRLRSVASFSPSLATSLTFDELGTPGPREDEGRGGHQQCQRASGEPLTSTALLAL
ncbi:hypothetical protein LshimejAT787_0705220 [Lyophyllum shimeji]|uniref:Uncharacterized protein n=1 Tax=Lyophyllum shimeji TaxID=47721 RepID=A0A9P3PP30_LYOSH|nr:hypothetical protein LshimejAT787_0705220 [Lyophyllum shimeji]